MEYAFRRHVVIDDLGDREQKKAHIEDRRLGIEVLHQNVGEKYLLCKTQHKPASVRISDDLFEAFNLTGIAAEVARTLPDGKKNAIRKTYKGHIKNLGVNGHFDSVKRELDDENSFVRLILEPDDSWNARQVKAKDIKDGLSSEVQGHLRMAMTMAKGQIPRSVWDSSVLGDLASDKLSGSVKQSLSARPTAPNTPLHPAAISRPKTQQASVADPARPRRSIKKRSYGDNSYEGYGEGYPDDDGLDAGYSTGEGEDRGAGQKRRKKNPGPAQFATAPVRQQSYGPGMVGA